MGQNTFPSASLRSIFAATTSFLSAFTLSSRICMLVSAGLSCANAGAAVSATTQRITTLMMFTFVLLPIVEDFRMILRQNAGGHNCQKLQLQPPLLFPT